MQLLQKGQTGPILQQQRKKSPDKSINTHGALPDYH